VKDDFVIRRYEASDRDALLRLLSVVYPEVTSQAAFSWRFEQNPAGVPILVVAEDKTGLIGFNSWMPWPIRWNGRDLRAWQSGESAVHPSARGRGVFGKLLKLGAEVGAAEDGDLFFGFPNRASLGSFIRAEWTLVHTMRWWVRPTPMAFFGVKPMRRHQAPTPVPFDGPTFEFVRDSEFVRWRIELNPYHKYRLDEADNGNRVYSRERKRMGLAERMILAGLNGSGSLLDPRESATYVAGSGARSAAVSYAATERLGARRGSGDLFFRLRNKGIFFIVLRLNSRIDERAAYSADAWEPSPFEVDVL
jgi:hypothetical protein